VLLDSGKVFCHHARRPARRGGKALDGFDLYARLQHHGNVRAAVRAAAQVLGIEREGQRA